ncbi:MAG: exopolysaccharide biosynthesis protein [Gloeomargarita sp. SKYBB_i_bin120]|nr:exopolysaccharide biosynthesis protein [Gloeomargarita sp. SKYB120]MDW8177767.1 exopolysaccharide biosynthesis protein [Gloeomargarita sp. SKYBB_i_bin120]
MPRLSVKLQDWLRQPDPPAAITVRDILAYTGESSWGMLFAILSFPSALPLPAPGYSTPFGALILILAVQWLAGRTIPWLPPWLLRRQITWHNWTRWVETGIPWLQRLERLTCPRWGVIPKRGHWVLGWLVALMGVSMIIPLPGTNTIPAMGIFCIGLGLIEGDGVFCLVGSLISLIGGAITTSILYALWFGGSNLIEWVKSLIAR